MTQTTQNEGTRSTLHLPNPNAGKPFGGKGDHDGDGRPGGSVARKMLLVTLKRNYVPKGEYEVVTRAEHEQPGVGFDNKLWAGSVIRVPKDEALEMYGLGIAERSFDD